MNKYIFKTLLSAAVALPLVSSCELDQYPYDSIPSEESWQSVDDANKFYNGLLATLRSCSGGSVNYVTEVQADLFNHINADVNCIRVQDWTFTTSQFDGDVVWTYNYGLVQSANNILDNIDQVELSGAADSLVVANIKGAAHFARAFAYSNMVVRYCQNYSEETADLPDAGLPLVTTVDVNAKPSRSTLRKTYELIESDLDKAEELLVDTTSTYTVLGKNVVTALRARVCLNMKKYEEAEQLATSLFEAYPLMAKRNFYNLWNEDGGTEIIYQPILTPDERGGGSNGALFIGWSTSVGTWSPGYVPTQGLLDLYESTDTRRTNYFADNFDLCSRDVVATGTMFNKFPGNATLRQPNENEKNSWYNMPKPFRIAEMYLIAAEAALFKTNKDEAAAMNYLNTLRAKRGASNISATESFLVAQMKNEWVREMVGEGFRLNCLKRWGDGVERMAPQTSLNAILEAGDAQTLNIQPSDPLYYKMIWEIPSQDLQANGNLVPNWK